MKFKPLRLRDISNRLLDVHLLKSDFDRFALRLG
jgi:hypothetical protein